MDHKRGSFSGKIGFVLSAAGASVGLGNIWRRQIRRRYFPAGIHHSGDDFRLHDDHCGDFDRPHDRQEPCRRLQVLQR